MISGFSHTDGHASLSGQHQAHGQRAGPGKAEAVHRGLWSGRLIPPLVNTRAANTCGGFCLHAFFLSNLYKHVFL